jgi:hypothetical protein
MKAKLNISFYPTNEVDAENNIIVNATIIYEKNQLKGFIESAIDEGKLETKLKKLLKNNIVQVVDETNQELEEGDKNYEVVIQEDENIDLPF